MQFPQLSFLKTIEGVSIPLIGSISYVEAEKVNQLCERIKKSAPIYGQVTLTYDQIKIPGILYKAEEGDVVITHDFLAELGIDGKIRRILPRTPTTR